GPVSRAHFRRGLRVASARPFHMTGHGASPSPPRLPPLRRLPPLDAGQDVGVVIFDRAVFHTVDVDVGRALLIAAVDPALGAAEPLGAYVIALEGLATDGDAFRARRPAARR